LRTMGLDLSYSVTGIVVYDSKKDKVLEELSVRTTPRDPDEERIYSIARTIVKVWKKLKPVYVGIENYSYGSPNGMARLGELGGVVKNRLWRLESAFICVPPTTLKKDATGSGRATKAEMVEAASGYIITNDDNVADAFHLSRYVYRNRHLFT
jgi:crossover junction endodeoxyribonuclease RuvC